MILRADLILEEMAKTFKKKNKQYGDNWIVFGQIMAALYPKGLTLKTEHDFARAHFLMLTLGKFTRYVNKDHQCKDSVHDAAVYLAMMEDFMNLEGLGNGRYIRNAGGDNGRKRKPGASDNSKPVQTRLPRGDRLEPKKWRGRDQTVQRRKSRSKN